MGPEDENEIHLPEDELTYDEWKLTEDKKALETRQKEYLYEICRDIREKIQMQETA
jgi:hypothetical protein